MNFLLKQKMHEKMLRGYMPLISFYKCIDMQKTLWLQWDRRKKQGGIMNVRKELKRD